MRFDEELPNNTRDTNYCSPSDNHEEEKKNDNETSNTTEDAELSSKAPSRYTQKNHPEDQIIGDKKVGVQTIRQLTEQTKEVYIAMLSQIDPKIFEEASKDKYWVNAMNEELDQIEKNNTWELVPRPTGKNVIGSKWVFKNKMNEQGQVIMNKAKLVCNGYSQV